MAVLYIRNSSGEFEGVQSLNGKTAYQAAKEGGYTGTESEFNTKLAQEIPTALPNPQPITINGQRYDGSKAVEVTVTGSSGANIDDTAPSTSTTYSSSKIESELTALNDANAALIEVSKTEPNAGNTELWIHPNADEVQLPQINDSVESEQDTWSSKKIAAEVSNKANDADLAVVAKSGSYNDLTGKPTIPTVPTALPNPNALTFTGAVTGSYDGSEAMTVEIPSGGGEDELPIIQIYTIEAEDVNSIEFTDLQSLTEFELSLRWDYQTNTGTSTLRFTVSDKTGRDALELSNALNRGINGAIYIQGKPVSKSKSWLKFYGSFVCYNNKNSGVSNVQSKIAVTYMRLYTTTSTVYFPVGTVVELRGK